MGSTFSNLGRGLRAWISSKHLMYGEVPYKVRFDFNYLYLQLLAGNRDPNAVLHVGRSVVSFCGKYQDQ